MPIFDYHCKVCKRISKDTYVKKHDEIVTCISCNVTMDKLPSLFHAETFPAEGLTIDNLEARPKTFHSKQEMRDYEKNTGAYIDAVH